MASALGLLLVFAGGLFEVAVAGGAPSPLPQPVAERLREGICDVLEADSRVDCAREGRCRFRRRDGTPFSPHAPDWWDVHALPQAVGALALGPAAALLGGGAGAEGPWEGPLGALSGIPWRGGEVLQLSPEAARWAEAQLPAPEAPMCGVTVREVYEVAFRPMMRRLVATWLQVETAGGAEGVDAEALGLARSDPNHPLARRCEAVSRAMGRLPCGEGGPCGSRADAERSALRSCRWWLRRHLGAGAADAARGLVAAAMRRYDGEWFRLREANFLGREGDRRTRLGEP